jgi:hypothetical protein
MGWGREPGGEHSANGGFTERTSGSLRATYPHSATESCLTSKNWSRVTGRQRRETYFEFGLRVGVL